MTHIETNKSKKLRFKKIFVNMLARILFTFQPLLFYLTDIVLSEHYLLLRNFEILPVRIYHHRKAAHTHSGRIVLLSHKFDIAISNSTLHLLLHFGGDLFYNFYTI